MIRTIGYEDASLDGFLSALLADRVSIIIDVRAVAGSRRRGFSKQALAAVLRDAGIAYLHLRDLGDPKPGREAARAGRMTDFLAIYTAHLCDPRAQGSLAEAARVAQSQAACLLCYEHDPACCHRTIVADAIARSTGMAVRHLWPVASATRSGLAAAA